MPVKSPKVNKEKKVTAKSKSVLKRQEIQAEAEVSVEATVPVEVAPAPTEVTPDFSRIVFEGAKVVAILPSKYTPTHFHCKMSDGSTKHVPKSLFE